MSSPPRTFVVFEAASLEHRQIVRSFFDPALIERRGAAFIREDRIDAALARLIPNAAITKGSFSYPGRSEQRDLVWNHMDQNHRPFIHRTYGDATRVFIGSNASFSLTRFGRWPVAIPVFDGYFKENGFYQIMVLFGLITVANIIECNRDENGTRIDVTWAIATHRWLRLLHPLLHRRLLRLNDVQNREDDPVRDRRIALRADGYRFQTDDPDFMNCNAMEHNTIFPGVPEPASIVLADLPNKRPVRVDIVRRAFILRRDDNAVEVWPGVCPHEGAQLDVEHLKDKLVMCPWHGLKFGSRRLLEGSSIDLCGARLQLGTGHILIRSAAPDVDR